MSRRAYLSVREAADALFVTTQTLDALIKDGHLRTAAVGTINVSDLRRVCPNCGQSPVVRHSRWTAVVGAVSVFGALALVVALGLAGSESLVGRLREHLFGPGDNFGAVIGVCVIAMFFAFGAILAAAYSAAFGQNKCRRCAHRWRV